MLPQTLLLIAQRANQKWQLYDAESPRGEFNEHMAYCQELHTKDQRQSSSDW